MTELFSTEQFSLILPGSDIMKIVYKITNSLVVLAIIPILIFLPLFRFVSVVDIASTNILTSLIGGIVDINPIIEQAIGINIEKLPEFYSIKQAYELFFGEKANGAFADFDMSVIPENVKAFFIAAFVLFAFALLCALLVLVFGIFTKKKVLPATFSALGFVSTFAANKCFAYIAEQLVSGKISVINLLNGIKALEGYQSALKYVDFDIRIFELSSAYTMMLILFGALFLLSIGFMLADSVQNT